MHFIRMAAIKKPTKTIKCWQDVETLEPLFTAGEDGYSGMATTWKAVRRLLKKKKTHHAI